MPFFTPYMLFAFHHDFIYHEICENHESRHKNRYSISIIQIGKITDFTYLYISLSVSSHTYR